MHSKPPILALSTPFHTPLIVSIADTTSERWEVYKFRTVHSESVETIWISVNPTLKIPMSCATVTGTFPTTSLACVLGDHLSISAAYWQTHCLCVLWRGHASCTVSQLASFHPLSNLEPFEHDFWLPTDTLGTIWTNMVHLQLIQVESNIANVVCNNAFNSQYFVAIGNNIFCYEWQYMIISCNRSFESLLRLMCDQHTGGLWKGNGRMAPPHQAFQLGHNHHHSPPIGSFTVYQ